MGLMCVFTMVVLTISLFSEPVYSIYVKFSARGLTRVLWLVCPRRLIPDLVYRTRALRTSIVTREQGYA
jgi:hypothetical protein